MGPDRIGSYGTFAIRDPERVMRHVINVIRLSLVRKETVPIANECKLTEWSRAFGRQMRRESILITGGFDD